MFNRFLSSSKVHETKADKVVNICFYVCLQKFGFNYLENNTIYTKTTYQEKAINEDYTMKKKIETAIHSLATEIRDNNGERSTQEWKELTMQLYEKLCVLEYLENQLEVSKAVEKATTPVPVKEVKKPIEPKEIETDIEAIQKDTEPSYDMDIDFKIDTAMADSEEVKTEQYTDESQTVPVEATAKPKTVLQPQKRQADDLQRFASTYKQTPVFSRKQTTTTEEQTKRSNNSVQAEDKPRSLNESLNRGLHIALNDRIAFINNLFEGSTQDFNRVLSQINTMDDFDAVQSFLEYQIMPDYNHWEGKEEFTERFINIIEKKFS